MGQVDLSKIKKGKNYSRTELAKIWGYKSFHALARGVVTPIGDTKIILFVTELKQSSSVPYRDKLVGNQLHWDGPKDHFAENRIGNSKDEIHLFYRKRHHMDFNYLGRIRLRSLTAHKGKPSRFIFELLNS